MNPPIRQIHGAPVVDGPMVGPIFGGRQIALHTFVVAGSVSMQQTDPIQVRVVHLMARLWSPLMETHRARLADPAGGQTMNLEDKRYHGLVAIVVAFTFTRITFHLFFCSERVVVISVACQFYSYSLLLFLMML